MTSLQDLQPVLKLWKQATLAAGDTPGAGEHPDDYELYHLAAPNGLAKAGVQRVAHLSQCPVCLEKLALWSKTIDQSGEGEQVGGAAVLSYGTLAAAASLGEKEALRLESSCGNFILGFYPQKDESDKAMISLELIGQSGEERRYMVRDAKGRVLIDGKPSQGRVARLVEEAGKIDLSCWTVVSM